MDRITVLCDGESDKRLFKKLKVYRRILSQIKDADVVTYPQARNAISGSKLQAAITPLHKDDRPDYIICRGDQPILVIEMTQHAYTGDNGLQRFARFAAAAENGVPFIYFGPRSRVRDDELDAEGHANPRYLTSDLFKGMVALATIYHQPQLFIEWKTDKNGLPAPLAPDHGADDVEFLFGELLDAMQIFLNEAINEKDTKFISELQDQTSRLAREENTRPSEVRFEINPLSLQDTILNPSHLERFFIENEYFLRGKPDKLLALFAIRNSFIERLQLPDGTSLMRKEAISTLNRIFQKSKRFSNNGLLFYTGYKWRSDPHCGVLVNADYRLCRKRGETTPKSRSTPLIVFYPRVSLSESSAAARTLSQVSSAKPGAIAELFEARYGNEAEAKMSCLDSQNLYSLWNNAAKQSRIFLRHADIIVLNDGAILGESLAEDSK